MGDVLVAADTLIVAYVWGGPCPLVEWTEGMEFDASHRDRSDPWPPRLFRVDRTWFDRYRTAALEYHALNEELRDMKSLRVDNIFRCRVAE